jgi:hypothetical protein
VRFATGPTTELLLEARIRGDRSEVRASDLGPVDGTASPWRQRWRVTRDDLEARQILADLQAALGRLSPRGAGGPLAVGPRCIRDGSPYDYDGAIGWMGAIALVGVMAFRDGYLEPVLRDDFPDGGRIIQTVLVVMTSVAYAIGAGALAMGLADRLWLPPLVARTLAELAGAVVTLALVAVLALAGPSWWIAMVMAWVVPIVLYQLASILGRRSRRRLPRRA